MRMSGHRTRAVFERYNVVDTQDLRAAVRALEMSWTRLGHTPCFWPPPSNSRQGFGFSELRGRDLNPRPSGYES